MQRYLPDPDGVPQPEEDSRERRSLATALRRLAAALPARRAAGISPIEALRND